MKKYLFIIAAAAAVLACEKVNSVDEIIDNPATPIEQVMPAGQQISFAATVEGSESKATLSSATNFTWESTDRAAVISHNGNKILLVPSSISGASATFTGTLGDGDSIDEDAVVVFPAARLTDGGKVLFPSSYDSAELTQGPTLAAQVKSKALAFKYLAGTVKLTINNIPSIATAIVLNTSNIAADASVVSTGTFDVAFDGSGIPSLTNGTSTGSYVTITKGDGASKTIYLPLPTVADQKVWLDVKKGDDALLTASIPFESGRTVTRDFFAAMNALNFPQPEVYVVGGMTDNWQVKDSGASLSNALKLTAVGTTHSGRLAAMYDNQFFRIHLKFANDFETDVQPDDEVARLTGTFTGAGTTNAVPIEDKGIYTITYDSVTGEYTLTQTSTTPVMYITNGWTTPFDFTLAMTAIPSSNTSERYFFRGVLGEDLEYKLYYNEAWGTAKGWKSSAFSNDLDSGNLSVTGTVGNVFSIFEVFASVNATGHFSYEEGTVAALTAAGSSDVRVMGLGGDWSTGIEMTQDATYPHIWTYDVTGITANTGIKVKVGGSWYGFGSVLFAGDGAWKLNDDDNIGIWGSAGEPGNWRIIFNDTTAKIHIYKTN